MSGIRALFATLDRVHTQWLATWVLGAFVATVALVIVLSAASVPLNERTKTTLFDFQMSGLHGASGTAELLRLWKANEVIPAARLAQRIDVAFCAAYGVFFLGLALALWRSHPHYPTGGRWVWLIALGAVAGLLDEVENGLLWWMLLTPDQDPGTVIPTVASAFAVAKYALLVVIPPTLFLALRRARA
jgi:hypothetical protein